MSAHRMRRMVDWNTIELKVCELRDLVGAGKLWVTETSVIDWRSFDQSAYIERVILGMPDHHMTVTYAKGPPWDETLVDGNKRVRSILDFVDGTTGLNPRHIGDSYIEFTELPHEEQRRILLHSFRVVEMSQATYELYR